MIGLTLFVGVVIANYMENKVCCTQLLRNMGLSEVVYYYYYCYYYYYYYY